MEFLIRWLASLFETFKLKSPVVAGIILLVLSAVVVTVDQGTVLGLFTLPVWLGEVLRYVALFLVAVTGSRTSRYLTPEAQKTRPGVSK